MSLYQHNDYRKALREILGEKKRTDSSVSFASYAEVIGVQKTFVSKVLGGNAHLSEDQFYLTLEFLGLAEGESSYFRLLYDYARTGLHTRKKKIVAEMRKRQEEQRQLKLHTTAMVETPEAKEDLSEYYLDPMNLIVHAALAVPKYAANPNLLTTALQLSPEQLNTILERLKSIKIIDYARLGSKVNILRYALHLDVKSLYCKPHQQLFRFKSADQIVKLNPESRFVYSLTFSAEHEIKGQIQEMYLDLMKKVEKLLDNSPQGEEVYQINFDLFPWTKTS